ncbi:MAG: 2,3-bisphosphoglycerate-independent phosphoglycerate mutase [Planctomycetales bacterium]|nr:2,3-bisphosphoglycerate-independent phosphoglycerate mutase [Planctomycetales bacterium]
MSNSSRGPVVLIVRDGWGRNPHPEHHAFNAVELADTPVSDALLSEYPWITIATSGEDVGLPDGVMGNSEVGHQNIGAGRIVLQELMRITHSVRQGDFFTKPTLLEAVAHVKQTGGNLHLLGLVSDGGVHSDLQHAIALIQFCAQQGLGREQVAVHAITDGRDTSPFGGRDYVATLEAAMETHGVGRVASVIGRFYAMDRDNRWDRVQPAYELLTQGSSHTRPSATEAIEAYYETPSDGSRRGDEFITPVSITATGEVADWQRVRPGDAVVFFNYRGDRPREITKAFVLDDDAWSKVPRGGFDRGAKLDNLYFATMTGYEAGLPTHVIFDKPEKMPDILGETLAKHGLTQLRIAESEKAPHVTFFFNDYRESPKTDKQPHPGAFDKEDDWEVRSPTDVSTYDQKPEMSAEEVTVNVLASIESGKYDFILINYANGDMVGHTGVLDAAIQAVQKVDNCVGRVVDAVLARGGKLVITADHGNCEQMLDPESGRPHTAHTTYDVDLIVVDPDSRGKTLRSGGRLADIAPTVLALMGLEKPAAMTGQSLLES